MKMNDDYFIDEWTGEHILYTPVAIAKSAADNKVISSVNVPDIRELFAKAVSVAKRICDYLLVKNLSERLSRVERVSGIRKSITGQDTDNEAGKLLWPSLEGRIESL